MTMAEFADWRSKSHVIKSVDLQEPSRLFVTSMTDGLHRWRMAQDPYSGQYWEKQGTNTSEVFDHNGVALNDVVKLNQDSPSKPSVTGSWPAVGSGDDRLIDVDFYF